MNIIVFDVETTDLAPRGDLTDESLCGIGISVACAFDYQTGEYSVYMADNLPSLWYRLLKADIIVGFNISRFDLPVLKCVMENEVATYGGDPGDVAMFQQQLEAMRAKTYDLYTEAKAGAGAGKYDRGYNCDGVLRATWGASMAKTGSGTDAPKLWAARKRGELVTYCLADVHRERLIFERCWQAGKLRALGFKDGKEDFAVRYPQELMGYGAAELPMLPFPLESPPAPAPELGPPFVHVPKPDNASDDI